MLLLDLYLVYLSLVHFYCFYASLATMHCTSISCQWVWHRASSQASKQNCKKKGSVEAVWLVSPNFLSFFTLQTLDWFSHQYTQLINRHFHSKAHVLVLLTFCANYLMLRLTGALFLNCTKDWLLFSANRSLFLPALNIFIKMLLFVLTVVNFIDATCAAQFSTNLSILLLVMSS